MSLKNYLTIKEVAHELEYSEKAIRAMVRQDAIPHIRIKKQRIRIPRKWLEDIKAKYPTEKEYKEAKEDIRFDADLNPVKPIQPKLAEPEIKNSEVNNDMSKKKTEQANTEIVASKPKIKPFIPNPKKRNQKSKEVKEPVNEYQNENELDNDSDSLMDDHGNGNNDQDFLSDYKGIGNY
jgi:hypothetical protein